MQLTDPQRRTLENLIGTGDRPTFPPDLAQRLRDRIEGAARELELAEQLWIGKEKLNRHGRCEGLFQAVLAGEIAVALNDVIEQSDAMAKEFARISEVVGKEGRLGQRAALPGAGGGWRWRAS